MLIYSYCSYDGSPCGFKVGCFDEEHPVLQNVPVQKTIQKAFDCGYVDFVCGQEPDKSEIQPYVIVMKKLQTKKNHKNLYLNFALELAQEEYLQILPEILHQYENTDAFACMLADMMIPDQQDTEFGLKLNYNGIRVFLDCVRSSKEIPDIWLTEQNKLFLFRKILPDAQNRNRAKEITEAFDFDRSVKVLHDSDKHCHIAQFYDINAELKAKGGELWNKIIKRKEQS